MTAEAVMAGKAGHMMGGGNAVAHAECFDARSCGNNFARYLMAKHQRGFVPAVPFHDIAAADAAGKDLYQQLPRPDCRYCHLFKPYIFIAVILCYAHCPVIAEN